MADQTNPDKTQALIRPKPPKARPIPPEETKPATPPESKATAPKAAKPPISTPPSGSSENKKFSKPRPSKPKKREKPPLILEHENLKAGDEISLPYTGKTVTVTHFHKTAEEQWFVLFDGGCVRQEHLATINNG